MQVETKYSIGDAVYRGRIDNKKLVVAYGPYIVSSVTISVKNQDGNEVKSVNYKFVVDNDWVPEESLFTSGAAVFKHYEKGTE